MNKRESFERVDEKYNELKTLLVQKYGKSYINPQRTLPYDKPENEDYSLDDFIPRVSGYHEELKYDYSNVIKGIGMTEWLTKNKYHIVLFSYINYDNNTSYSYHELSYKGSNFEKCKNDAMSEINININKVKETDNLKREKEWQEKTEKSSL